MAFPGPAHRSCSTTSAAGCSAARSLTRPASRGSAASSGRPLRTRTAAWTGRSKASTATSRRGSGATGRWSASTSGIPTSRRGGSTSPPPGETSGFPWPPRFSPSGASIARATPCSPRRSCGPASSARSARRRGPIRSGSSSRTAVVAPSAFGTLQQAVRLPAAAPLGYYQVGVSLRREGEWKEISSAGYRVAEYRPPEFLVDVTADTAPRFDGDTLTATIGARYLFGAPMGRARVTWSLKQTPFTPWETDVPNSAGFYLGSQGWWWEEFQSEPRTTVSATHTDTLDATGHLTVRAPLKLIEAGRATAATLEAVVTDVNRQTVSASP